MSKILNIDANPKTVKGQARGFLTGVLYLAPGKASGFEVCAMRTKGCTAACLGMYAGRANIIKKGETTNPIRKARVRKTRWFFEDRQAFMAQVVKEIEAMIRKAERMGLTPTIRLNGSSDIVWEKIEIEHEIDGTLMQFGSIYDLFPEIQFYDYTKRHNRRDLPANLHLTFSLAEDNDVQAYQALANGMNVAVVFFPATRPETFMGCKVVNGDADDLRFLDPKGGVVIGLKAKGEARNDTTGFVR